jgi:uncharacterized membrane protein
MTWLRKYLLTALALAIIVHLAIIFAVPQALMNVALKRLSDGHYNQWRLAERVTPLSRTIVRPSPDFAYSACPYDLADGPVVLHVAPWDAYWSLSLYADNSDNFFTLNDREAQTGADITLIRRGSRAPETTDRVAESPSTRGVALIRRLAPTAEAFAAAGATARDDVCARLATLSSAGAH